MASLLFAASVLSYDAIKKQNLKRKARRAEQKTLFSKLERENAARISTLQSTTCFCQRSDWRGAGCETHRYVPADGPPPLYMEHPPAPEAEGTPAHEYFTTPPGAEGRETMLPEYQDADTPHSPVSASWQGRNSPYQDRWGQEDGVVAAQLVGARTQTARGDEERRRINEERRRRGVRKFALRWKRDESAEEAEGSR